MIVGVPKEIKVHESRVAITPEGVSEFVHAGHTVIIEDKAGLGSSITNEEFITAGATIVANADDVWQKADLVLKVKEPIEPEYSKMRKGQTLFTYLHSWPSSCYRWRSCGFKCSCNRGWNGR